MSATTPKQQLDRLAERYFAALFEYSPHFAARLGFHEYDGRVPDLSAAARERWGEQLDAFLVELRLIDTDGLERLDRYDYALIEGSIEQALFDLRELRPFAISPIFYLWPISLDKYIKRSYAPLQQRVGALIEHMRNIPVLLSQARENLTDVARPQIEISLDMFDGMIDFLRTDLTSAVAKVDDEQLQHDFAVARDRTIMALEDLIHHLREGLLPTAPEDFAIGAGLYRSMLRTGEFVDLPLEELLAAAEADLERNKQAALEVAARIDPARSPDTIMRELAHQHPAADELIRFTADMLEEQRQFLIDHDLVSVPSEVRIGVKPTPPFLRWAFAMIDPPGPFEQVATEAYYYITLPDPAWSAEQQEEWLSKFNNWTLSDVSIHEAYPGHYLHFLHTKHAPTKASKIFGAYSFWEGWAHYCEEMMLDAGYGDGDPRLRLSQLSEALLRDCRFICAIKMHTQGMSVEEATSFMMEQAFMERTPAEAEARRGTFDPGYLNYTLGKLLLLKLREDYRAERGDAFSLRSFHDEVLSYGAPPIPYLRKLMLKQDSGRIL